MPYTKDSSKMLRLITYCSRDRYGPTFETFTKPWYLVRTRTGDRNPNWRAQVKAQQNAATFLEGCYDDLVFSDQGDFTVNVGPTSEVNREWGHIAAAAFYNWWTPSITTGVADNRAMQAFLKKVHQARTAFSGLTFMGELRESLRMIRSPAKALRDQFDLYLRKVKRDKDRYRTRRRWEQAIASSYLEGVFGWVPLVSEIREAVNVYDSILIRPNQIPVVGIGIEKQPGPPNYNGEVDGYVHYNTGIRRLYSTTVESAFVKYKGAVVNNCIGANRWGDAKLWGFTLEEFAPTAWELLPWSFLIDYFTNIGDIVQANIVNFSDVAWVNRSEVVTLQQQVMVHCNDTLTISSFPDYISHRSISSTAKAIRKLMRRSPNAGLYVPRLEFSLPGLPAQWANMTALLAQAGRIHPQRFRPH